MGAGKVERLNFDGHILLAFIQPDKSGKATFGADLTIRAQVSMVITGSAVNGTVRVWHLGGNGKTFEQELVAHNYLRIVFSKDGKTHILHSGIGATRGLAGPTVAFELMPADFGEETYMVK